MSTDAELQFLIDEASELGATEARQIEASSIVTAAWVWMKCRFGCGGYGSNLCCPPHSPKPDETRRVIDCYRRAVLVHCKPGASVKEIVVTMERSAFLRGYYKAFALGAGPCHLCEKCNLQRCTHAREARPALEACGVDVYATVRANGYPLEVVTDKDCDQNYYGVVLVD